MIFGIILGFLLPLLLIVIMQMRFKADYQKLKSKVCEDIVATMVDFRLLAPAGSAALPISRLDTDGDGWKEWVVPYQYDIVGRTSPIFCVVYDPEGAGGRDLPVIYPHKLHTPDSDYLGEGKIVIGLADVLKDGETQARPELVISGIRDTVTTTLAIFQVDTAQEAASRSGQSFANPYHCQGFFRGTLKITRAGFAVSVWDRAGSERSQFALRRVYWPSQGSYFQPGTTALLPPAEASIEFAYGIPDDILDTPYPEKLVLAFYMRLKGDVDPYLTEQARKRLAAGQLDYGSPWPLEKLQKVLVQEISYVPDSGDIASASAPAGAPPAAQVRARVLFLGPGGESILRSVQWHLIQQENRWKLHDVASS